MSVKISGKYIGSKRVEILHEQSGSKIKTVAPLDNNGDGTLFSPTDLFAASFPTCVLTIMSIIAEKQGFSLDGAAFELEKHMISSPRRVGKLSIKFSLPASLSEKERKICEGTVSTCPVHGSLHPDVELDIEFVYT